MREEILINELLLSKLNKSKEHPRTASYSNKKDEEHVINMVTQMGLEVEVFVALADAWIEERNLNAHFNFREHEHKMLDCRYLFHRFP